METMSTKALTQAKLDEVFELLIAEASSQDVGTGKYYVIVSKRTHAQMEQAELRYPKRQARKKALYRK